MSDKILLTGVHLDCHIGVPKQERVQAQEIELDVELFTDVSRAGQSDRFEDTIDYAAVRDTLVRVAMSRQFALVESLAESMAAAVLAEYPVEAVRVLVRKPRAMQHQRVDWAGVDILRKRNG